MMINSYSFGKITINGTIYTSDVIIYKEGVEDNWWRKKGHLLQVEDLEDIINYNPEILIIGTGENGLMKVSEDTKQFVESKGIEMIILETSKACNLYSKLNDKKKIVAALHLTC